MPPESTNEYSKDQNGPGTNHCKYSAPQRGWL